MKFKKYASLGLLPVAVMLCSCAVTEEINDEVIWYQQPASVWEEALPVGNGRIGAMVFGKTDVERIQLNDDSLWPAEAGWDETDGNEQDLKAIRELLIADKAYMADDLIVEKFSRKDIKKSHQTLGDLFIELNHDNITDYRRELNLSTGIAEISYKSDGNQVTQTVLASHPHQAIIIRFTSDAPEGLNGRLMLTRPDDNGLPTVEVKVTDENVLMMTGEVTQRTGIFDSQPFPVHEGVKFETRIKAINQGGGVTAVNQSLQVQGVKELTLILVSNSSYYHDDYSDQNVTGLSEIDKYSFNELVDLHVKDHRQLYSRVNFQLEGAALDTLPTDKRIERLKNGEQDPALEAILFQYGRYLLIGSSRQGTNPANLQGLWNQHIEAPWNADYHLNINLQMNYWLADVTGLGELNMPLFDYIDLLVENGKEAAKRNFGCRGSFIPHASDLWGATFLQARTAYWGSSFGAGGWLMQHYWQHYEFHRDTTFLRERAFPAMHQVALFYSDWLMEDPRDQSLIAAPSTSPENRYYDSQGRQVALSLGTAIDQQTVAEVFDNYSRACEVLNVNNELLEVITDQRKRLREGFVIGSDGRILEWDREYSEPEPGHRHMSHLYGFHPGVSVTKTSNPQLFDAVRKTLDYRLANGGAGTGWSRAWLINCAARLMDGNMAHEHIRFFFTNSMYDNLFCSHPPYQIDGNFGYTAGIAEMIIQSHEPGIIRILPALPSAWKNGSMQGLLARGGYKVDVSWKDGQLDRLTIDSPIETNMVLMYNDSSKNVSLKKGKNFPL